MTLVRAMLHNSALKNCVGLLSIEWGLAELALLLHFPPLLTFTCPSKSQCQLSLQVEAGMKKRF